MPNQNDIISRDVLRPLVRGTYDIQELRIAIGNRITRIIKNDLGFSSSEKEDSKLLESIRKEYRRITDGLLEKFPKGITNKNFNNSLSESEYIKNYSTYCLVKTYDELLKAEEENFKQLEGLIKTHPMYSWFKSVKGCGPIMSAVILSEIDISRSKYVTNLWAYCGLDTITDPDGNIVARPNHTFGLVEREYTNKKGELATRKSVVGNPFLKKKLLGVLAESFVKLGDHYREIYDNYKFRISNDPRHSEKSLLHKHNMAKRYMIKMFILDMYKHWKTIEGQIAYVPYHEAKLGLKHGSDET